MNQQTYINWKIIMSIALIIGLVYAPTSKAAAKDPKVLVIFSSQTNQVDEHQRLLDMLISHFTEDISFKNSSEVGAGDMKGVTHLFYYGQTQEQLPPKVIDIMATFNGTIMSIGLNIEQQQAIFPFIKASKTKMYTEELYLPEENKTIKVDPTTIIQIESTAKTLIEAKQSNQSYPLLVNKENKYYYATNNLFPPISNFLAEALHEVFNMEHRAPTQVYLRLEDVNPASDSNQLMEIAKILKRRDIPYMVSVTPVYLDRETDEEYHIKDAPDVRAALKYMKDNGGSIILHGYTDQYENTKTGDGFEFWDATRNSPIVQNEQQYIDNRIQQGLQDLVEYELYPLAFEAPHYAMSQAGYETLSEHFSTIIGQVQLTDKDWRIMTESPYITKPTYLHGMKLLPETIRYVRYEEPQSIQEMKSRIHDFTTVRDGVIGGFYHPFLGARGLIEILEEFEKIPGVQWIDLKKLKNTVKADGIWIESNNGKVDGDFDRDSFPDETVIPLSLTELFHLFRDNTLWVLMGAAITLFVAVASLKRGEST
ncbi:polysaccharide deacetylase family protein [Fredinandcohnia sp. FSL W7-1320]|uniref:polysaccharide deacetylase family protein n=1 Tax=Fredinandcohnia sp. FSL W7-1320 TaxID=2954540 RepID=UPI0030FDBB53